MRYSYRQVGICVCLVALLGMLAVSIAGTEAGVVTGRMRAAGSELADVPVLNYHKIDYLQHALSLSPEEFDKQMAYLASNGYHTISPDQLMAYLNHGKRLPDKPIMITFDDGYLDNYNYAYPIMKKYGFTATIFLVTGLVSTDERFMTWEQVRQMQQEGFVFGSHTVNHVALDKVSMEQAKTELVESRRVLKEQTGQAARYFAYPTGAYNLQIEELVRQAGYRAAFTIRYGQVGPDSDPYAMERIPLFKSEVSFRSFLIRLNGAPVIERLGLIRN